MDFVKLGIIVVAMHLHQPLMVASVVVTSAVLEVIVQLEQQCQYLVTWASIALLIIYLLLRAFAKLAIYVVVGPLVLILLMV